MFKIFHFNTLYVVGSKMEIKKEDNAIVVFQYIICCWFNADTQACIAGSIAFQYIICCWFNEVNASSSPLSQQFQYIICCWFNQNRFNALHLFGDFNTLYVVGSIIEMMFKRYIC